MLALLFFKQRFPMHSRQFQLRYQLPLFCDTSAVKSSHILTMARSLVMIALLLSLACSRSKASTLFSPTNDHYNRLIQRRLEDGGSAYFEYDLNNFSLRFDRCQHVKMYNDEMAGDEESDTALGDRHFVVFRLCPTDECSTCDAVYGQYVMEVDEYLQATVREKANQVEQICGNCQEECNEDGSGCTGCGQFCFQHLNLEANGYVSAADYLECQQVPMNNNDEGDENDQDQGSDNDQLQLYIGPRCSNNGARIELGLFQDEDCLSPYTKLSPEDVLAYNISYELLSHTCYANGSNCLSCKEYVDENDEDNNQAEANNQQDVDDINEMCERVYGQAAKCETIHGIDAFVQSSREDEVYENQVMNEVVVCEFIKSLLTDTYTETGDIYLASSSKVIFEDVTPLQKTAFSLLSVSIVCLLLVAFFIQRQIERASAQTDLACQSDPRFT
jgi:hypothetical protein